MTKTLLDGTVIELQQSSRNCPPGFTGQAGNRSSVWFRVNDGDWEQIHSYKSFHANARLLESAETVDEFRKLIRG